MTQSNNQNQIKTNEVAFTLKRTIKRQNMTIIGVSRSFEVNGETIYSDNISREAFHSCCDQPDIFRLVELFAMGELHVGQHTANRTENRKYFAERFKLIWRKLRREY